MRHLVFSITIAILFLVLSGCLVKESDPPKVIYRSTAVVKPIVNGDYYEYEVNGQITNTNGSYQPITGTLTVTYYTDSITLPFSTTLISVIREETVLNLGAPFTTTRYIQQNGDGSLQVLAADFGGVRYRTGPKDGLANDLQSILYLPSPIPSSGTGNLEFQYLQGCETIGASACNPGVVMKFDETLTYYGDAVIQTLAGRFNALRYDFSGSTIPVPLFGGALFDFRTACSTTKASYLGSVFIFPEVGIVSYDYSCQSLDGSGTGHNFFIDLRSTNVTIPNPQ